MVVLSKIIGWSHRPGNWWWSLNENGWVVAASCPKCGEEGSLASHNIRPDGKVSPKVRCYTMCGFTDVVVLSEWKKQEVERE